MGNGKLLCFGMGPFISRQDTSSGWLGSVVVIASDL